MKTYSLTKSELENIQGIMPVIMHYQQVMAALQLQFQAGLISGVFQRLGIPAEMVYFAKVELSKGDLIIEDPKEEETPEENKEPVKVD